MTDFNINIDEFIEELKEFRFFDGSYEPTKRGTIVQIKCFNTSPWDNEYVVAELVWETLEIKIDQYKFSLLQEIEESEKSNLICNYADLFTEFVLEFIYSRYVYMIASDNIIIARDIGEALNKKPDEVDKEILLATRM